MNWEICASMICANQGNLEKDTYDLIEAGVQAFHIDVMDGMFVPRFGMYPEQVKAVRKCTSGFIDAHMMVTDPEPYIDVFAESGLDLMSVHVEGNQNINRTIGKIANSGMKAGIILNTATGFETLDWVIHNPSLKRIMLMGINPGVLGQGIWKPIVSKISSLRRWLELKGRGDIQIQIDGSVKKENSHLLIGSGAYSLVCGTSTIFRPQEGNLVQTTRRFEKEVNSKLYPHRSEEVKVNAI